MRRAIASSSPVKLWMSISDDAVATKRSWAIRTVTRRHPLQTLVVLTQHKQGSKCDKHPGPRAPNPELVLSQHKLRRGSTPRPSPPHVRQDLLAEQADLLVAVVAPQLEHD